MGIKICVSYFSQKEDHMGHSVILCYVINIYY